MYPHANSIRSTYKEEQLEILGDFNINIYHNSVCINHNLVYRFGNVGIKRLILIRIVTPLTSEAIIVTMCTLSYTIKVLTLALCSIPSHTIFIGLVYILAQFK